MVEIARQTGQGPLDVIRRPCMGLPPGAPCPAHKWGTWPQDCICYQEGNYPMQQSRLMWIFVGVVLALVCLIGTWFAIDFAFGADVDKSCMTKAQAAAQHPGKWLYWHGPRHCWDDHPGRFTSRAAVYGKKNTLKLPPPPLDANANVPHHSGRPIETVEEARPTIFYPSLMSGSGTSDAMLHPEQMTTWPVIADFDLDPPQFIPWQKRVSAAF